MQENLKEIWKDIEGYEGAYQVSDQGNVKTLSRKVKCGNGYVITKEKILSPGRDSSGYLVVRLSKNNKGKTYKIHRLVAIAFIPNPLNLPQVNHKDENKINPKADNLEWCTNKYNCNYGTHNERMSKSLSKKVYQYTLEGKFIRDWKSTLECNEGGFNHRHISECCLGKRKTHKKFKWSYIRLIDTKKEGMTY